MTQRPDPAERDPQHEPRTQPIPVIPGTRPSAGRRVRARWARRLTSGLTVTSTPAVLEPLVRVHRMHHAKADVGLLARAYALSQTAMRRGTIPIFLGPFPQGAVAGGNLEATITAQEQRAKSLIASGSLVFDAMPYLGIPRAFNAGFTIDDLHPNDAGHTALTAPFADFLRRLI